MERSKVKCVGWTMEEAKTLWELYCSYGNCLMDAVDEFVAKYNVHGRTPSSIKSKVMRMSHQGDYIARNEMGFPLAWTHDEDKELLGIFLETDNANESARQFNARHPERSFSACVARLNRVRKEHGMKINPQSKPKAKPDKTKDMDNTDYYVLDVGQFNIDMREQIFAELEALR